LTRAIENRYAAGRLAAAHLAERGYRTFAYVGFTRESHSAIEREHFTRELSRLGKTADAARTFVSYASKRPWRDKVAATVGGWLGRIKRPAGLFVATPRFARLVADLALGLGLSVPEDLGIVAADNDPVLCELAPALTSIAFDYAQVGRRAAELLGHLMDGARPPKGALLIEPTLVPRRSTDRQGLADPLVAKALHWIDDRRTEFIRPAHVAEAVGLSPRTLGERMLRARGRTVMHEIVLARITHAKLLLGHSDEPVRPIARQSGFGSYAAMLHAFRQHVGVSPAAWRRGEKGATDEHR
ncbi:substrate-binding domain-containing protein, partial [bacterium]|nr:substrate-binding domain-containing protein [bacterium]